MFEIRCGSWPPPPPSHKDGGLSLKGGFVVRTSETLPLMGQGLCLPKHEHNLLCFSLAEEEIKAEQEVGEGMDISTRSKGE